MSEFHQGFLVGVGVMAVVSVLIQVWAHRKSLFTRRKSVDEWHRDLQQRAEENARRQGWYRHRS